MNERQFSSMYDALKVSRYQTVIGWIDGVPSIHVHMFGMNGEPRYVAHCLKSNGDNDDIFGPTYSMKCGHCGIEHDLLHWLRTFAGCQTLDQARKMMKARIWEAGELSPLFIQQESAADVVQEEETIPVGLALAKAS